MMKRNGTASIANAWRPCSIFSEVALELFDRHGYGAVTIETIAKEAEVGTASVYRYFGTKDRIVTWDEADEGQVARLLEDIAAGPLDEALRRFAAVLDAADGEMRKRTLARMSLIASEPALAAQAALNSARFGAAVAEGHCRQVGATHGIVCRSCRR